MQAWLGLERIEVTNRGDLATELLGSVGLAGRARRASGPGHGRCGARGRLPLAVGAEPTIDVSVQPAVHRPVFRHWPALDWLDERALAVLGGLGRPGDDLNGLVLVLEIGLLLITLGYVGGLLSLAFGGERTAVQRRWCWSLQASFG